MLFTPLVIDYNNIIVKNRLEKIEKKVEKKLDKNIYKCPILVLIIDFENQQFLDKLNNRKEKLQYINTTIFINSIIYFCFLELEFLEKRINIYENLEKKYFKYILSSLLTYFPVDFQILLYVNINKNNLETVLFYISNDFDYPKIDNKNLILYRSNKVYEDKKLNELALNHLSFVLEKINSNSKVFYLNIVIDFETIKYLRKILNIGATINQNNSITQKEIAARFYVNKIEKNSNNDYIHYLDFDKNSIIYGEEEKVYIVDGLYNIHSHPKSAYEKYKVSFGWPSAQDYIGFLSSVYIYGTILHTVLSLEGIYFISITEYFLLNLDEIVTDKVFNYIIDIIKNGLDNVKNIEEYLEMVNNIEYKNRKIFRVEFMIWLNNKNKENKEDINIKIPIKNGSKTRDIIL